MSHIINIIGSVALALFLIAGLIEWYFHRKRNHIKRVIEIAKED